MDQAPDNPKPARQSVFAVWAWPRWAWVALALLILVVYPLSIGPVSWLSAHGYIPKNAERVLTLLYLPVFIATFLSPALWEIMGKYVTWWSS
jgi:hypothetical protein